jgi:hypothetical protein
MVYRFIFVYLDRRTEKFDLIVRKKHFQAECRSSSTLAKLAVTDDRLKRRLIGPIPDLLAKTAAS